MSLTSSWFGRLLPSSLRWLTAALLFLASVVVARFVLELVGVAPTTTRYISSSAGLLLAAIYLGAVAPSRGVAKFTQLILPSL